MKIAQIEKKAEQIRTLRWLEKIQEDYRILFDRIEREKEYFIVQALHFTARGDGEVVNFNPHRTIPYTYIRDGLWEVIVTLNKEIAELVAEIEK